MKIDRMHDPMGRAIEDFFEKRPLKKLVVKSSLFEDDEMPIPHLFRTEMEMNEVERMALNHCKGRVLDVGAGAGCHTLALQDKAEIEVTAIDVSPRSVEVMQKRGIRDARWCDFFDDELDGPYDTLLLMMNGIGIVGELNNMSTFFTRAKDLLTPDGCILMDSSDLIYLFDEEEEFDPNEWDKYYGEIDFQMNYGKVKGKRFNWLYIDQNKLTQIAKNEGFDCDILYQGENYHYLAKLRRR